ncbi:unnamed protein product [Vicia faba]|uniref:Uncharacterized protein n=1 Tax=Vicia faba TaxID=3906 RepID=A0AAV0YRW4_VICFA|nr:unnamed protein product [Vicia faba]
MFPKKAMGRGRGRPPKNPAPPSPDNQSNPVKKPGTVTLKDKEGIIHESSSSTSGGKDEEDAETLYLKSLDLREEENSNEEDDSQKAEIPKEERKLWVDVLNKNREPSRGREMKFIAPKVVNREIEVEIEEEDAISEI